MRTSETTPPHVGRDELGRQGFGAMRLRDAAAEDPDRDPVTVIEAALDAGITLVDTADAYQNEELVGRAIRPRRDEVVLASKFGLVWREETAGGFDVRADPEYVRQASEASLLRLGVETIDLYYLHHRSDRIPIEETVGAITELIEQGKVRALGLSNVTSEDLRRAHAVHPVAALQEQWSLVNRDFEQRLLPTAAELGIPVVAHSPTGHGLLHRNGEAAAPELENTRRPGRDRRAARRHVRAGGAGLGAPPGAGARRAGRAAPRNDQRQPPPHEHSGGGVEPFREGTAAAGSPRPGPAISREIDAPVTQRPIVALPSPRHSTKGRNCRNHRTAGSPYPRQTSKRRKAWFCCASTSRR
nr:aldo/keto reductase [Actinopolyspora erythraea]